MIFPRLLIAGWNDNIANRPVDRIGIALIKVWHGCASIPKDRIRINRMVNGKNYDSVDVAAAKLINFHTKDINGCKIANIWDSKEAIINKLNSLIDK